MIIDPHSLQVSVVCLVWKSTPNLLWSIGGATNNDLLRVRKDNLALMAALSLISVFTDSRRPRLSRWFGGIARLGYRTIY